MGPYFSIVYLRDKEGTVLPLSFGDLTGIIRVVIMLVGLWWAIKSLLHVSGATGYIAEEMTRDIQSNFLAGVAVVVAGVVQFNPSSNPTGVVLTAGGAVAASIFNTIRHILTPTHHQGLWKMSRDEAIAVGLVLTLGSYATLCQPLGL